MDHPEQGSVVQLVERLLNTQKVVGSSPARIISFSPVITGVIRLKISLKQIIYLYVFSSHSVGTYHNIIGKTPLIKQPRFTNNV